MNTNLINSTTTSSSNNITIQDLINQDCPYTAFPTAADTIDRKIDLSLDLVEDIKKYYTLIDTGNFSEIENLLKKNPRLSQCVITSKDLNVLRDGIVAMQRWVLNYIGEYLVQFSKPKGEWNKDTKYEKYNAVTYAINHVVQTYIAFPRSQTSLDIPIGTPPTDTNYWTCITLRGEKGESGTGMTPRGVFISGIQYYKDDLVSYNNAFWYAIQNNIDQVPNANSESWKKLMEFSSDLLIFNNANTTLTSTTVQDAIIELSRRTKWIKNVTIAAGGFINNIFTYYNTAISANHKAYVEFEESSIVPASKSRIIVNTYDGYMTFKVKKIPTVDLKIESIELRATF